MPSRDQSLSILDEAATESATVFGLSSILCVRLM
jgi:hypothetical protein